MDKYIGLTIGPIYKTMMKAKRTRELWGASYLFSYLMKKIIEVLFKTYKAEFIIPFVTDPSVFEPGKEVGLFHDRLIAKVKSSIVDELQPHVISMILQETAQKMAEWLGDESKKDTIETYLKEYLSFYFCEVEAEDGKEQKEINKEINGYLDVLELQSSYLAENRNEYIIDFLKCPKRSFLIIDAYDDEEKHNFPCIPEIAAKELDFTGIEIKYDKDEDNQIIKKLQKQNEGRFKTYHKYIAIVQADGDDLGKTIASLESDKNNAFRDFSEALFEFATEAHKTINYYGGTSIYAGGDDLLFFAPVMYKNVSVFEVCHKLGNLFRNIMAKTLKKDDDLPTMSFGISISYYKYPMYEALEAAQTQLFSKSKGYPGKNAVSFRYLKHSGASFDGTVSRNSEIYPHFRRLITAELTSEILTSVIHDIRQYNAILLEIGADLTRLRYFFENKYNKDIHEDFKGFFESVTAFIHEVCCTCKYSEEEKIHLIHSVLKLKKNLMGEEDK